MSESRKPIIIRVSPDFHKVVRMFALDNDVTVQDYVKGLIIKDVVKKRPELKDVADKA